MSFFKELFGVVNDACEDVKPAFRAVIVGESSAYFESVLSVKSYSTEKIEIKVKGGEIVVKGNGLVITKYCSGDLAVCGKVLSLERI